MPLTLTWQAIAIRLALACLASFVIGFNRDEHGHPAGMRTTMLVCVAATLAMLQVNLLLAMSGKTPASFAVMDLMRLPLGILSGIGFIGAGVIIKRRQTVVGLTTAATMWYVTVLGLLFGGGQLVLGCVATLMGTIFLWGLKWLESLLPRERHGVLSLKLSLEASNEEPLRQQLIAAGYSIRRWNPSYDPPERLCAILCELHWQERAVKNIASPEGLALLRHYPGVHSVVWDE